jgi:hypothetical protein
LWGIFKKQLFDLEVKGQGPTKVITVRDTPPYGHAHMNYLEACPDHNFFVFRDRSMIFRMWVHDHKAVCRVRKKQLFDLEVKDQGPTKVITVRDTPPYGYART